MQRKLAEILEEMDVGTVYYDYSGRGMNGRTTTGLVIEGGLGEFMTALYDLSYEIQEAKEEGELDDQLTNLSYDELGLQMIIY